jgi:hypothetical protein
VPVGTTDWLADLLGPNIYDSGTLIQPNTNDLNFIGPTISYNPATRQVDIVITSGAGSTLVVANILALSAVDDLALSDGAIAAMASVKDLWWLDKTSTLATDGITVINTEKANDVAHRPVCRRRRERRQRRSSAAKP